MIGTEDMREDGSLTAEALQRQMQLLAMDDIVDDFDD